jgi:hypothetical protein
MIGGSARAQLRPWQLSCPNPPSGFSPCLMNTTVSTASPLCPAMLSTGGTDKHKAATAPTSACPLHVKPRMKLFIFSPTRRTPHIFHWQQKKSTRLSVIY